MKVTLLMQLWGETVEKIVWKLGNWCKIWGETQRVVWKLIIGETLRGNIASCVKVYYERLLCETLRGKKRDVWNLGNWCKIWWETQLVVYKLDNWCNFEGKHSELYESWLLVQLWGENIVEWGTFDVVYLHKFHSKLKGNNSYNKVRWNTFRCYRQNIDVNIRISELSSIYFENSPWWFRTFATCVQVPSAPKGDIQHNNTTDC